MKKVKLFISQPMHGLTEHEVYMVRETILAKMREVDQDVEYDPLYTYKREDAPEGAGRLWYLGRSIQDLDKADLVIFAPGWREARGCVAEHDICEIYGIQYKDFEEEYL